MEVPLHEKWPWESFETLFGGIGTLYCIIYGVVFMKLPHLEDFILDLKEIFLPLKAYLTIMKDL